MGVAGDGSGVHLELIPGQGGVELRHEDGVDGVPLQQHRRQAEGQGVVGTEAFQRRAGVEDAAVDLLCVGQQGAARLGEGHLRRGAAEQRGIQLFFEASYLVAEGGLGAIKLPRSGGEIQRPAHREEAEKLVLVHGKSLLSGGGICVHPQYSRKSGAYKAFLSDCLRFFNSLLLRYILYYLSEERFSA